MTSTPQLSPLEQLTAQQPVAGTPSTQTPPSNLSPLEQLTASTAKQTSTQDPSEIPETSYGAATWGAVKGIASDTVDAVKGAANFLKPTPQSDDEQTAYDAAGIGGMFAHRIYSSLKGSAVSPLEIASAIHDINNSKDPVGTYLKVAQKTASQGAGQALTALATEGVVKAVPMVPDVASGVKSVANDVVQGEKVAQAPAKAALHSGAQASAVDAGVSAGAQGGSIRSLLDDPIGQLATKERAAYNTINDASGTDLKSLYDLRNKLQDGLEDPTQIANEDKLQTRLDQTEAQIKTGEAQAVENGVDPDTLNEAKEMTKQRYAMENVNQKLFNNEGVISGNATHGAPETIDVDSAIRQAENLDKPSKFAPRGTPSRLEQAFGEDGAQALKQSLYDAKKAGQTAVARQQLAKTIGKITGYGTLALGGADLVKHLIP